MGDFAGGFMEGLGHGSQQWGPETLKLQDLAQQKLAEAHSYELGGRNAAVAEGGLAETSRHNVATEGIQGKELGLKERGLGIEERKANAEIAHLGAQTEGTQATTEATRQGTQYNAAVSPYLIEKVKTEAKAAKLELDKLSLDAANYGDALKRKQRLDDAQILLAEIQAQTAGKQLAGMPSEAQQRQLLDMSIREKDLALEAAVAGNKDLAVESAMKHLKLADAMAGENTPEAVLMFASQMAIKSVFEALAKDPLVSAEKVNAAMNAALTNVRQSVLPSLKHMEKSRAQQAQVMQLISQGDFEGASKLAGTTTVDLGGGSSQAEGGIAKGQPKAPMTLSDFLLAVTKEMKNQPEAEKQKTIKDLREKLGAMPSKSPLGEALRSFRWR